MRTDGRRQRISYSLVSGNDDNRFDINSQTGMIRVANPTALDFETNSKIILTVQATLQSGLGQLYGHATVIVSLTDQNDNPPKFTQSEYSTSVWEGNNKGTFVMQVCICMVTNIYLKIQCRYSLIKLFLICYCRYPPQTKIMVLIPVSYIILLMAIMIMHL